MAQDSVVPRSFNIQGDSQFNYIEVDNFSCVEYRHDDKQRKNQMLVTSFLFVVILSGEKIIHTEKRDLYIKAGSGFFAQKGSYLFSETLASSEEYHALIFFISDTFLSDFLLLYPPDRQTNPENSPPAIFRIYSTPLLLADTQSILPYFQHHTERRRDLLRLKLEELFLHVLNSDQEGNFHSFLYDIYSSRKQNLLELMEKYYREPVTISELASLAGRSISSFKRDFSKSFQETPRRWINNRKLEQAKVLLLSSDKNVSEICFEVGFNNISHFSQLFRKKFGCPPGDLKKTKFNKN